MRPRVDTALARNANVPISILLFSLRCNGIHRLVPTRMKIDIGTRAKRRPTVGSSSPSQQVDTHLSTGSIPALRFVDESHRVSQMYKIIESPQGDEVDRLVCSYVQTSPFSAAEEVSEPTDDHLLPSGLPISSKKDAYYMSRYVEFIGPWFDLFDSNTRHFSEIVPQLALDNPLLQLACLAAAARQHSLVTGNGQEDALTYYNDALRTLSAQLQINSHEPATFASCLLIAHCEMIESKAGSWNLHLKGTCELVMAHGYNGQSGGLAQAVRFLTPGHGRKLLTAECSASGSIAV